jgi:hypothetical protein
MNAPISIRNYEPAFATTRHSFDIEIMICRCLEQRAKGSQSLFEGLS